VRLAKGRRRRPLNSAGDDLRLPRDQFMSTFVTKYPMAAQFQNMTVVRALQALLDYGIVALLVLIKMIG
jgi:hypothetical protein